MSHNRLTLQGLAELREGLRKLPAELTADAAHIVEDAATAAATDIKAAYPRRTGKLVTGVSVTHAKGTFSTSALVKNTAKHAWIFENGTQGRHTAIGANRGAMPPGHVFIPAVIRHRRRMQGQLIDVLKRAGLQVSGG